MIHKLLKRPQAIIGLCLIAIVIVIAIAAPAFSPHDPELVNLSQKYAQPDAEYPLGTDQLGRCTLSRLLYGARYSIGISLPVLLILSVIGLIVGTFSACAGEKADHFITITGTHDLALWNTDKITAYDFYTDASYVDIASVHVK